MRFCRINLIVMKAFVLRLRRFYKAYGYHSSENLVINAIFYHSKDNILVVNTNNLALAKANYLLEWLFHAKKIFLHYPVFRAKIDRLL